MARTIADNLRYYGKKFIDERGQVKTIADLLATNENYLPNGFLTYCQEDSSYYRFDVDNIPSETTGKWQKVGSIVTHQEPLDADGNVAIFKRSLGIVAAGGSLPAAPAEGDYILADRTATFPYTVGDVEFTEKGQVATYVGAQWKVTKLPLEGEIHVFDQPVVKYVNSETGVALPAKLVERLKISDKAAANGWVLTKETPMGPVLTYVLVIANAYSRGTQVGIELGSMTWVSNMPSYFVIKPTGVEIGNPGDIETIAYEDITSEMVMGWKEEGYITTRSLESTYFEDADVKGGIMVHVVNDRTFDCLVNFTEKHTTAQQAPLHMVTPEAAPEILRIVKETGCLVGDENGDIVHLTVYKQDVPAIYEEIVNTTTPAGFVFDREGFWTKIFPADFETSETSPNPVANGVVTRAINAAGHSLDMKYDEANHVIVVTMLDNHKNEISKVGVCIGGDDVGKPQIISFRPQQTLLSKADAPYLENFYVKFKKGSNKLDKIELISDNDATIHTWTAADFDAEAEEEQDVQTNISREVTDNYRVRIYDVNGLYAESEVVAVLFVTPCLFNEDGTETMVEKLSADGHELFDFRYTDNATHKVKIMIPTELYPLADRLSYTPAILGGVNRSYLLTDYTESFDSRLETVGEGDAAVQYRVLEMIDACGFNRFTFGTVKYNTAE